MAIESNPHPTRGQDAIIIPFPGRVDGAVGPTPAEATAANSGVYAPGRLARFVERFKWPLRLTAVAGAYIAYENVPAIHESVDSLGKSASAWVDALTGNNSDRSNSVLVPLNKKGPSFLASVPAEYVTPTTTDKTPAELAKEAGYNILSMKPDDNTGRTVFYDWRGPFGLGGIGETFTEQKGTDGKTYRSARHITGSFVSFEAVPSSKDQYIILKNPLTGDLLPKVRVAFENEIFTTDGTKPTLLTVSNISLDPDKALSLGVDGKLGYIPQWPEDQLGKIIQPGDAIGISLTAVKGISTNVPHEEGNVVTATYEPYFAGNIALNRFGGKGQIEQELASQ